MEENSAIDKPALVPSAPPQQRGLQLSTYEELYRFAVAVIKSGFAPKDIRTPEAAMTAMQMGAELGLLPMQALQNIAVINGRPAVFGDALPALILQTGQCADLRDEWFGTPFSDDFGCRCIVARRGVASPVVRDFTVADAKKAQLWGKQGPWSQYPKRMLQVRARAWACRDAFPDALKGLYTAEEVADFPGAPEYSVPPLPSQSDAIETTAYTPTKPAQPSPTMVQYNRWLALADEFGLDAGYLQECMANFRIAEFKTAHPDALATMLDVIETHETQLRAQAAPAPPPPPPPPAQPAPRAAVPRAAVPRAQAQAPAQQPAYAGSNGAGNGSYGRQATAADDVDF